MKSSRDFVYQGANIGYFLW